MSSCEAKGKILFFNTLPQYGLQTAFSEIERKDHSVTSSGNPIELDMTTMYKVKGIGKETTITSKVNIFHENGKITRVEDKWNGNLPDSGIANVSNYRGYILNPVFWIDWAFSWGFAFWVLFSNLPPITVRCFCVVSAFDLDIASSYLPIYLLPFPCL